MECDETVKNQDDLLTKVNLLTLAPMEDYQTPDLPTYQDTKPDISKKIPRRWKNKAMAVTSLFSMTTLTGCSIYESLTTIDSDPWETDWLHHGGAGGSPLYVAYLTEQEALGIIRAQLAEVGLKFEEPLQSYSVQINWNTAEVILVHEEKDIRIAFVDRWWGWNNEEREMEERFEFTENAIHQFADEFEINVNSVIFNFQDEVWTRDDESQRREEIEADLIQQVQDFINRLREDGIIE